MNKPMEEGRARLRLMLTVSYDLNGCAVAGLERRLRQAASRLADEGLLSGESMSEVTEWDAMVEQLR